MKGKTFLITGASRGIGKAIALRLAREGANIVIASKSVKEDGRLEGTIFSAAEEIEAAGGKALPVACDIRFEDQISHVMEQTLSAFGRLDGLVNNASAISLADTEHTETKRFDLMHSINVRGTFLVTKQALPLLRKSGDAHILTLSPPLNITPQWMSLSVAYSLTKFNMSMMTIGWAEEFRSDGIAANALWPVSTIATAAIRNIVGGEEMIKRSRKPDIMADAAYFILSQPASGFTGNLLLDEEALKRAGITSFDHYAVSPGASLQKDLFL